MQAKPNSYYVCRNCTAQHARWFGQCPACGQWSTLDEVKAANIRPQIASILSHTSMTLQQVSTRQVPRYSSGIGELDRVFGGGLVVDSAVLLGGHPGAGKSTLLMQAAEGYARQGHKVHYVSGEESVPQLADRAHRIGVTSSNILLLAECNLDYILREVDQHQSAIVILDSLQKTTPGQECGDKETRCAEAIIAYAKARQVPWIIVNHVTKDLELAGPERVKHLVDAVFALTSEEQGQRLRILRSYKNRYGSTEELGLFEMRQEGMLPVTDPSGLLLGDRSGVLPGTVFSLIRKGNRPLLVEVQALLTEPPEGKRNPKRFWCVGIEQKRVEMIVTLLEHSGRIPSGMGVMVNVVGGLRVEGTDADLAVARAILSSRTERAVDGDSVTIGEIGLSGEVRAVPEIERRVMEIERLGFLRVCLPQGNRLGLTTKLEVQGVRSLEGLDAKGEG